jgi:hypothetical protein
MSIQWFSKKETEQIATIYDSNITLNKVASDYFKTAFSVMLGFDETSQHILIKPLDKDATRLGHIPEDQRNPISVWQSSARIANKAFISRLTSLTGLHLKRARHINLLLSGTIPRKSYGSIFRRREANVINQ